MTASETETKRISPRAIWLFFITYLIRLGIIPVGFGMYILSLLPDSSEDLAGVFYISVFSSIMINVVLWVLVSFLWAWITQSHFQYSLSENYFQKEMGVLYKKRVTIPYENIQNIEIYQRVLPRILGLSEMHIETASHHSHGEGRLPGILYVEAERLKEELLQRSHAAKLR